MQAAAREETGGVGAFHDSTDRNSVGWKSLGFYVFFFPHRDTSAKI